jgi:hypothetical protein
VTRPALQKGYAGFAKITDSDLVEFGAYRVLRLKFLFKQQRRQPKIEWFDFPIFHADSFVQFRNRCLVMNIAVAVGVDEVEDSEQLHDKVFAFSVIRIDPIEFRCDQASAKQIKAFDVAVSRQGVLKTNRSHTRSEKLRKASYIEWYYPSGHHGNANSGLTSQARRAVFGREDESL